MIEFLRAENWQYVWLALLLVSLFHAFRHGSEPMQKAALMLAAGWFLTNIFWMEQPVYLAADVVFGAMTARLWLEEKETPLLRLVTLYASMLVWHLLNPAGWMYMAVLNLLFAGQCLVILLGCVRHDGRSQSNA